MRNQINYNKPVGIKDGALYLVNYTFEDEMHGKPFKGVTGSVLSPLTQREIDSRNDVEEIKENYKYFWQERVQSGNTEESLDDFIDSVIRDSDGLFVGHDESNCHYVEVEDYKKYFDDLVAFECIGGGRCFNKDMEFDVILDQHLLDEINRLEEVK